MGLSEEQRKVVDDIKDALGSSLNIREVLRVTYPLLQRVVPADHAALGITVPGNSSAFEWIVSDMPEAFFEAYPQLARHDFVLRAVLSAPNRVCRENEMISRSDLEANIFYQRARDLQMPIERVMSAMLHVDGHWSSGISLYRTERRSFSDEERSILQQLVPAFGNAVRNCRQFDEHAGRSDLLASILEAQEVAVVVVEPPAREVARTEAAERLLQRWFTPCERRFGALPAALKDRAEALAMHELPPDGWLVRRSERGELWARAHRVSKLGIHCLALVLHEACEPTVPDEWARRLTPRELEVAARIVEGLDYRYIAESLGMMPNTLKRHVYSIFDKLGVDNRAQLTAHARRPPPSRHAAVETSSTPSKNDR